MYLKHCKVMVIRRGDVTDIAWVFVGLEMNCLISLSPGRSVDYVPPLHHTTRCFDKPQTPVLFTHIWASVVLANVIMFVKVWEVQYLSDPCLFGYIF